MLSLVRHLAFALAAILSAAPSASADDVSAPGRPEPAVPNVLAQWQRTASVRIGFDEPLDRDFPLFPWQWSATDPTRPGQVNPYYVRGRRQPDRNGEALARAGGQCFRIEANGGPSVYRFWAAPERAALPLDADFSYRLSLQVRAAGLTLDGLRASRPEALAVYVDEHGAVLGFETLSPTRADLEPPARWIRLQRNLSPHRFGAPAGLELYIRLDGLSLEGAAWFDDILIERTPRADVRPHRPGGRGTPLDTLFVADPGAEAPAVSVQITGLQHERYTSRLTLTGPDGALAAVHETAIAPPPALPVVLAAEPGGERPRSYRYEDLWTLPFTTYGLYRLRHELIHEGDTLLHSEMPLAFMRQNPPRPPGGPQFGARLIAAPADPGRAASAIEKLGVAWVKLPVWSAETTLAQLEGEAMAVDDVLEALHLRGLRAVGTLNAPPDELLKTHRLEHRAAAGMMGVFEAPPGTWRLMLQATAARFGSRIDHWQLGPDSDASFHGHRLGRLDRAVRDALGPMAHGKRFGAPVDILFADPDSLARGPGFLSLAIGRQVAPALLPEIGTNLQRLDAAAWLSLNLLPRDTYGEAAQLRDLALRLAHASREGWDVIYPGRLAGAGDGLLDEALYPTRAYLAARTLIGELAGYRLIGVEPIQPGIDGYFFADSRGTIKLLAWSDSPQPLDVFLGHEVAVTDLDGNTAVWNAEAASGPLQVYAEPRMYSGIDRHLMQTRLSFRVEPGVIVSTAVRQRVEVTFTNHFPQPVEGYLQLLFPDGWHVSTPRLNFSLVGGETYRAPIELVVPGTQPDGPFDLSARVTMAVAGQPGHRQRHYDVAFTRPIEVQARDVGVNVLVFQDGDERNAFEFLVEIVNTSNHPVRLTATLAAHGILPDERALPQLLPGRRETMRFRFVRSNRQEQRRVRFVIRDMLGEHFLNRYIQLGDDIFYDL